MRLSSLVIAASCAALLSGPLAAQTLEAIHSPELHGTVGEMVEDLLRTRGSGVRTKVVNLDTTNNAFLFPSAGSVQGAGGTFFKSDGATATSPVSSRGFTFSESYTKVIRSSLPAASE